MTATLPARPAHHPRDLSSEPACPARPCPVPQLEADLAPVFTLGTALPALDGGAIEAQRQALLVELCAEHFRVAVPHVRVADRRELLVSWGLEKAAEQARCVADDHLRRCGHLPPKAAVPAPLLREEGDAC